MTSKKFFGGILLFLMMLNLILPKVVFGDMLIPYVNIFGVVRDHETNQVIEGAEISFEPAWDPFNPAPPFWDPNTTVVTDEFGMYFFIFSFPPEKTDVIAKAKGYKDSRAVDVDLPLHSDIQVNFSLEKEEELEPLILVPGIMASYLENTETSEEVWPNLDKMVLPGEDSFFHILEMSSDGIPYVDNKLKPTDIFRKITNQDFFHGLIEELKTKGYKENKNLFVFPYDWRLDINWTAGNVPEEEGEMSNLKDKIIQVKQSTGSEKVDIIAHSMGGLLVKKYLQEYGEESVDRFIDIATPHFGAPKALKIMMFGDDMDINFLDKKILNSNMAKDITQNMSAVYQLLPSRKYFDEDDKNYRSYISDIFDMDNNGVTHGLGYEQSLEFMKNTDRNKVILNKIDEFHNSIDDYYFQNSFNIVGCSKPTIGRVYILNKEKSGGNEYSLRYISGDGTVPVRSAEGYGAPKIYINNQTHAHIPSTEGVKQLVAHLLKDDNNIENFNIQNYGSLSTSKGNNFCTFSGKQISFHSPIDLHIYDSFGNHVGPKENGDLENNIPGVVYDILEDNKFAFLPEGQNYIIKGNATGIDLFNMRVQKIQNSEYVRTAYFNEIPLNSINTKVQIELENEIQNYEQINLQVDEDGDDIFEDLINPSSVLEENQQDDFIKPSTEIIITGKKENDYYIDDVMVELTAEDNENGSGILKTEYSLDDGESWEIYSESIILKAPTTSTEIIYNLKYSSTDRAGNREEDKQEIIKIKKYVTIQLAILDIENLYNTKDIKKKFVQDSLIRKLKQIDRTIESYDKKIEENKKGLEKKFENCEKQFKYQKKCEERAQKNFDRTNNRLTKVYERIVDFQFKILLKTLNLYHKRSWITNDSYGIIKTDVELLQNQDLIIY